MRHRAPTIAQNALPVIDDPWITFVPWPIQTAPVRTSTAPTTRLAMTMNIPTRGVENWFPSCWASFERFHYRLRRCSGMSPELREVQDFDLGDRAVRREEDGGRLAGGGHWYSFLRRTRCEGVSVRLAQRIRRGSPSEYGSHPSESQEPGRGWSSPPCRNSQRGDDLRSRRPSRASVFPCRMLSARRYGTRLVVRQRWSGSGRSDGSGPMRRLALPPLRRRPRGRLRRRQHRRTARVCSRRQDRADLLLRRPWTEEPCGL